MAGGNGHRIVEDNAPPGPEYSFDLTVQLVYYLGDGPDPTQCTEDRPMGDSAAATLVVKINAEDARALEQILDRVWSIIVKAKQGDRVAARGIYLVTADPKPASQEAT